MTREAVVIQGRGYLEATAYLIFFFLVLIGLAIILDWLAVIELLIVLEWCFWVPLLVLWLAVSHALERKRFVISDVDIEYRTGKKQAYWALWQDIRTIEIREKWKRDGKPVLGIRTQKRIFTWMLGDFGVPRRLLQRFLGSLQERAGDHPHIRVIMVEGLESVEETELFQQGKEEKEGA